LTGGAILGKAWFDSEMGTLVNLTVEQHMTLEATANGAIRETKFNLTANSRLLSVADD
jgi:hypothetical protein